VVFAPLRALSDAAPINTGPHEYLPAGTRPEDGVKVAE